MKTLVYLLFFLCILAFPFHSATAERFDLNPDHVPSIGFSGGLGGLSGDHDVKSGGTTFNQDIQNTFFDLTVDFKIPVSDTLTFFGSGSLLGTSIEADETSFLTGSETNGFGAQGRLGLRIYFQ